MEQIYLCGFMGCGKSTVGKQLAKQTGKPFIDLDKYIVEQNNMTIPEIFEKYGEEYFRQLETDSLRQLASTSASIIALGGGTLMRKENVEIAKENGKIIFLNPPFSICYSRIKNDKNRPLVVSNTREQLYQLYRKRQKIYKAASDISISSVHSPFMLAKKIIEAL